MRVPLRPRDICALALVGVFALAASGTHVVRNGETLSSIASSHGTSVRALVEANGIANPNLIIAGQELTIPGGGSSGSGESASSTYTVRAGDTLATIAARHGTTVRALADANGITDPNLIVIGRDLKVLAASGGGSSAPRPITTSGGSGKQLPGQRHTVQPGDTIAGIAARYGLSSTDLVAWNGLVDGRIYATTRLVLFDPGTLPGSGGGSATGGGTHVVGKGDTLGSIASRYGVRSSTIAAANGITDPNRIRIGQRLTIPGSSGGGGGGYVCPVAGATFFNDWGFPRSGGRSHAGTDLFAPRGTPVRAPTSGWLDTAVGTIGGKQFRLTARDGTLWFGSHMDAFGATGQVSAGDIIGYVGDSGNAKGSRPHLHFEVHPGGRNAVNPYPLLRSSC